jgi:hypothetical protein
LLVRCSWWFRWGRRRWSRMDRKEAQHIFQSSRRVWYWRRSCLVEQLFQRNQALVILEQ